MRNFFCGPKGRRTVKRREHLSFLFTFKSAVYHWSELSTKFWDFLQSFAFVEAESEKKSIGEETDWKFTSYWTQHIKFFVQNKSLFANLVFPSSLTHCQSFKGSLHLRSFTQCHWRKRHNSNSCSTFLSSLSIKATFVMTLSEICRKSLKYFLNPTFRSKPNFVLFHLAHEQNILFCTNIVVI